MTEKLNWKPGDTCVMVTNKAKGYTTEFTVESFDGKYYGIRHGAYYHRVSPNRIFPNREAALASLEQKAKEAANSYEAEDMIENVNDKLTMGGL